jgi:16S rRNA (cytidine1402-2'-O)-methyltransferase
VALVSDAGTPAVSDPGYRLIEAALARGIRVEALPGASAVLAALVSSGLPTNSFTFAGFPPARGRARTSWLNATAAEPRTVVFFEAPHRLRATLTALHELVGDRTVALGRELTKLHEQHLRGTIPEVLAALGEPRGEFTVILAPPGEPTVELRPDDDVLLEELDQLTREGVDRRAAIHRLAERYDTRARVIYQAVERAKLILALPPEVEPKT